MIKACSNCSRANGLNLAPKEHDGQIDWDGTSGATETGVALELYLDLHYNSGFDIYIHSVCSDDDSTMQAHL